MLFFKMKESKLNESDWLKKYYPVKADEVKGTDIDLIDHSIRKWEGLLDLELYGLSLNKPGHYVKQNEPSGKSVLLFDGESCALCQEYYDEDNCDQCPLSISIGKACDRASNTGPGLFRNGLYDDPQIMIDALKKARELVIEKETKQ